MAGWGCGVSVDCLDGPHIDECGAAMDGHEALETSARDWLLLDLGRIRPHLCEPCEERASGFLCTLSCLHPGSPGDPLGWPHQTQNSVEPREWINTWVCLNKASVKQPAKSH